MKKKTRPIFLDNILSFSIPTSWSELSQVQMRYVFFALAQWPEAKAKTHVLCYLLGIKVHEQTVAGWLCSVRLSRFKKQYFYLSAWQVHFYMQKLDFLTAPNYRPVRLQHFGRWWGWNIWAIDSELHGLSFEDYLVCENYYQGFLVKADYNMLREMAKILYHTTQNEEPTRIHLQDWELLSIMLWWQSCKNRFSVCFTHFFQPFNSSGFVDASPNMMDRMNIQIRALTGGDITKEHEILEMDCWRALTELDAKAREAEEYNNKFNNHG